MSLIGQASRLREESRRQERHLIDGPRTGPVAIAVGLFLAALALRLYRLDGRSLWLDEVLTSYSAHLGLRDVIASTGRNDQVPLMNLVTWAVAHFWTGPFALRLPAALFGAAAVAAMFWVGREIAGTRVGVYAGLLACLMSFPVWYSQEARPYSALILATTLQLGFAYRAATTRAWPAWTGLGLSTAAALYTQYLALLTTAAAIIFVLAAIALRRLAPGRVGLDRGSTRRDVVGLAATLTAVFLIYVPWLPNLLLFLGQGGPEHLSSLGISHRPTLSDVERLLTNLGFTPLLQLLLAGGTGWTLVYLAKRRAMTALLLGLWLTVPLAALGYSMRGALPTIWARYLAVIFPAGVLLAAFGAEALTRLLETGIMRARTRTFGWVPQGLVALVLVAVTVAGLPSLYAAHKDDWKDATRIALHSRDGTAIVAVGVQSSWVVQNMGYYFALEKTSVPLLDVTQVDAPTVEDLRGRRGTVWLGLVNGDDPSGLRAAGYIAVWPRYSETSAIDNRDVVIERLVGVTLVRAPAGQGDTVTQLATLLRWASQFDPRAAEPAAIAAMVASSP
jgi:mannosyltransferase